MGATNDRPRYSNPRDHYEVAARPIRDIPSTHFTLDTSAIGVAQAARFLADWAARQQT
jgi:hypothetical protein